MTTEACSFCDGTGQTDDARANRSLVPESLSSYIHADTYWCALWFRIKYEAERSFRLHIKAHLSQDQVLGEGGGPELEVICKACGELARVVVAGELDRYAKQMGWR